MKGFIEVTVISRTESVDKDGFSVYGRVKDKVLINISDIARLQFGGILLKTPFANGDYHCQVEEGYQELKQLIKSAMEVTNG